MDSLDYLLNLKQNQILMVKARGYSIEKEEWILDPNLTGEKFKKQLVKKFGQYPIRQLMFSEYICDNKRPLVVFFVGIDGGKQIKVDAVYKFTDKITNEEKDGILVINAPLSTTGAERLKFITESKYQVFDEEELTFNKIEHVLQPSYEALDADTATQFKKLLGLTNKSLPVLHVNDPISKYYHFQPGQIIRIIVEYDLNMVKNTIMDYAIVV